MKLRLEMNVQRLRLSPDSAFTLMDLLVVVGTLSILALLLLPAFAASKPGSKVAQCLNNQRQLAVAWQMYASDNGDVLVSSSAWIKSTPYLDWASTSVNTNAEFLTNSTYALFASYIKTAAIYKCPADVYQSAANPGPRDRSVSLNDVLGGGSGPTVEGSAPGGEKYFGAGAGYGTGYACTKLNYLAKPGPACVFLFLDEHPDSINDGTFLFNPGYPIAEESWRDLPASYHNNGAGFSFADGHTELHIWQNQKNTTCYPVLLKNYTIGQPWTITMRNSLDYEWMDTHMPYR